MSKTDDAADLVVCCEVLEHVREPAKALDVLRRLDAGMYIFSVPDEPLWRFLNMLRGAYWSHWGNTPGHIQHWNKTGFHSLLRKNGFDIVEHASPLPWLAVLAVPSSREENELSPVVA